jgi:hypothetical protein
MISLFQNELNLHKRSRSRGSSSQLGLKLRTAAASVCRFFGCGLAFPVLALMSILRENPSLCKEPTMKLPSIPVGSSSPIHPEAGRRRHPPGFEGQNDASQQVWRIDRECGGPSTHRVCTSFVAIVLEKHIVDAARSYHARASSQPPST